MTKPFMAPAGVLSRRTCDIPADRNVSLGRDSPQSSHNALLAPIPNQDEFAWCDRLSCTALAARCGRRAAKERRRRGIGWKRLGRAKHLSTVFSAASCIPGIHASVHLRFPVLLLRCFPACLHPREETCPVGSRHSRRARSQPLVTCRQSLGFQIDTRSGGTPPKLLQTKAGASPRSIHFRCSVALLSTR